MLGLRQRTPFTVLSMNGLTCTVDRNIIRLVWFIRCCVFATHYLLFFCHTLNLLDDGRIVRYFIVGLDAKCALAAACCGSRIFKLFCT